jgi:DNA polymerase-4
MYHTSDRRRTDSQDHPYRHGRVLCVGGATQRSDPQRQARRGRLSGQTRRRCCGELRGARFWSPLSDAVNGCYSEVRGTRVCPAKVRRLPRSVQTGSRDLQGIPPWWETAKEIRARIYDEIRLTASAGISCNKFLAKIASDYRKPNGQFAILPDEAEAFVATLPIAKFHRVGPKTTAKMHALGIETGADLRGQTRLLARAVRQSRQLVL